MNFPIENRWKATVVGTPPDYRAELPEKIPLKKRRIEILDREVPGALWHDRKLRYSYALQKDPAPLVFMITGTGGYLRLHQDVLRSPAQAWLQ